jgi:hypothetical protein
MTPSSGSVKPGPLSFVFFARDSARLAAREARALRAASRRRNDAQRHAEHCWEGEGGNYLAPPQR